MNEEENVVIKLSQKDWELLMTHLEKEPERIPGLVELFKRAKSITNPYQEAEYICERCNINEAEDFAAWCEPCNTEWSIQEALEIIVDTLTTYGVTKEQVFDRIITEQ